MNKFLELMSKVVVAIALVGSVTGCNNIPFLGRNQSANQVNNSPTATQNQRTAQTRVQPANQPGTRAQSNQTTTQDPNVILNPEAPNTATGQSDSTQSVPALW